MGPGPGFEPGFTGSIGLRPGGSGPHADQATPPWRVVCFVGLFKVFFSWVLVFCVFGVVFVIVCFNSFILDFDSWFIGSFSVPLLVCVEGIVLVVDVWFAGSLVVLWSQCPWVSTG
jgi:hypothetical protein